MQLSSSPLSHSRIEHLGASGFPAVSIIVAGSGVFDAWSAYQEAQALGISSQRSHARSVGLFMDFCTAFGADFLALPDRPKLFKAFADALLRGTLRNGEDPSGLYWLPRTRGLSGRIVAEVTQFSDWLTEEHGVKPVNPVRQATAAEQIAVWRAWRQSFSRSLLKHLRSTARERGALPPGRSARVVKVRGQKPVTAQYDTKAFPDDLSPDLLASGFRRVPRRAWTTLRDQLIALLLHEGGLSCPKRCTCGWTTCS